MFRFKDEKIEKKLTRSFLLVSLITAVSALLGLIAVSYTHLRAH